MLSQPTDNMESDKISLESYKALIQMPEEQQ